LSPAKAARTGEISIVIFPALSDKCVEAHNWSMPRILERIRAWRLKRKAPSMDPEASKDWKMVGKTFRATDTVYDKNLPHTKDDGRPRY
jgi:hypothetical protein